MNIYTEFEKELLERLSAIESRLESIERMMGDQEEDCPVVDRKEAMDKYIELLSRPDPILEPEWHSKETAPDGKLVRIAAGGFQGDLIGIKVEPNLWRAWKLNDDSNEVLFISNVLVYSWRELTIEESAYAWENRILGASAEHAELSTLEPPIAKQEPEWMPMITAPRDGTTIMGGFRDPHTTGGNICIEEPIYWLGSYANNWFHRDGNNLRPVMIWKVMNTLKGWRPL